LSSKKPVSAVKKDDEVSKISKTFMLHKSTT
jgi:hypothetical protein